MTLTPKQKVIASIIDKYIEQNGSSPTVREVAKSAGISPKGAQDHIEALCKKGYYIKSDHKSRSLKWAPTNDKVQSKSALYVKVKKNVAPEGNLFQEEYQESATTIPILKTETNKSSEFTCYAVEDNSLKEEGILKGDIAVIEETNNVKSGDIVAYSTLASPFNLAFYTKENNRIKLQKGKNEKPSYVVEINLIGKLYEIRRSYI